MLPLSYHASLCYPFFPIFINQLAVRSITLFISLNPLAVRSTFCCMFLFLSVDYTRHARSRRPVLARRSATPLVNTCIYALALVTRSAEAFNLDRVLSCFRYVSRAVAHLSPRCCLHVHQLTWLTRPCQGRRRSCSLRVGVAYANITFFAIFPFRNVKCRAVRIKTLIPAAK